MERRWRGLPDCLGGLAVLDRREGVAGHAGALRAPERLEARPGAADHQAQGPGGGHVRLVRGRGHRQESGHH